MSTKSEIRKATQEEKEKLAQEKKEKREKLAQEKKEKLAKAKDEKKKTKKAEKKREKERKDLIKFKICEHVKDDYDRLYGSLDFGKKRTVRQEAWDEALKFANQIGSPIDTTKKLKDNIDYWIKKMKDRVEEAKQTGHGKRAPLMHYEQILRDVYYSQSDTIKVNAITFYLD